MIGGYVPVRKISAFLTHMHDLLPETVDKRVLRKLNS